MTLDSLNLRIFSGLSVRLRIIPIHDPNIVLFANSAKYQKEILPVSSVLTVRSFRPQNRVGSPVPGRSCPPAFWGMTAVGIGIVPRLSSVPNGCPRSFPQVLEQSYDQSLADKRTGATCFKTSACGSAERKIFRYSDKITLFVWVLPSLLFLFPKSVNLHHTK